MKKILVSLKHTKAVDEFITLWRANNSGYTLSLSAAGRYEDIEPGYHDSENTLPVDLVKAIDCGINHSEYITVIPNDNYTREALGLKIEKNKLVRS